MNLVPKFTLATTCKTVPLWSLDIERPYRILHAERVTSQFEPSVALTTSTSPRTSAKIFLPKRYAELFTDSEIDDINAGRLSLDLFCTGTCPRTNAYKLSLQLNLPPGDYSDLCSTS
jgi:hypothetical protein